jgi:hypothetical protein
MKRPYILFVMAAMAFGCGDKDKFLFTQVSTGLVVNAETKTIVKNNTFVNATLDSTGTIRTLGSKVSFTSSDLFQTFNYTTYALPGAATPVNVYKNTIAFASGTYNAPALYYSSDYGYKFDSVVSPVLNQPFSTNGFYATELVDISYLDNQSMMMLYIQKATSNIHTKRLYKVNIATKQADSVWAWQDKYSPVAMRFTDTKNGWILMYSNTANGTYISRTSDGGKTWTAAKSIDTRNMPLLQPNGKGNMVVYESEGNAMFSADSGATWKKTKDDIKFNCVQKVDAALVYGINSTGFIKSTDSGQTWTNVSNNSAYEFANMKNLSFKDAQNGIMYTDQKMFVTSDGGVTWKTILYPYPYIIGD